MRVREDRALAVLWLAAGRAGKQRETERECKCEFMWSVFPQITINRFQDVLTQIKSDCTFEVCVCTNH